MLRVLRSSLQHGQNNLGQSLEFFQHPLVDTHTIWVVKTWKEEHLKVFHVTWDKEIHSYPYNQNIWFILKIIHVGQLANFMVFLNNAYLLKFKKDKTFIVSPRVLNVKITFCKMQVLHNNVDWIKRKIPNLEKTITNPFIGYCTFPYLMLECVFVLPYTNIYSYMSCYH